MFYLAKEKLNMINSIRINEKITVYTNQLEYDKFHLVQNDIEQKLELITGVNIRKNYNKVYEVQGIVPRLGEIEIIGRTTEDNDKKIKNIVNEIRELLK